MTSNRLRLIFALTAGVVSLALNFGLGAAIGAHDRSACADEPDAQAAKESEALPPNYLRPGADPWVIEFRGKYYWSQSNNATREIRLWESDSLDEPGKVRPIWQAPPRGPYSRELWAPEIHFIDGKFYVFFAADNGRNERHLTYVLVSENDDPYSEYRLEGPLYTGDDIEGKTQNRWAIDCTFFEWKGRRYVIWSGWEDDKDVQYLYIAEFATNPPRTISARVKICDNADYLWERVEERLGTRGLNEGPEILTTPNGRVFLSYSCGASWLPTYKIGLLELVGDDPTSPESWKKYPTPFFQSDQFQFGVGHGSFIKDRDGETRYVYHAKTDRAAGWNRKVFWRYVDFDEKGFPSVRYAAAPRH